MTWRCRLGLYIYSLFCMAAAWSKEQQEAALATGSPDGSWLESQRQQLMAAPLPAAHPSGPGITASQQSVQVSVADRSALPASAQQQQRESAEPAADEGRATAYQPAPEAQSREPAGGPAADWAAATTAGSPEEHAREEHTQQEALIQNAGAASRGSTHLQGETVASAAASLPPSAGLTGRDGHAQVHAASDWPCTEASTHGRPWSADTAQADRPLPSPAPSAHGARRNQGSAADSAAGAAPRSPVGDVQARQPPPAGTHDEHSARGRRPAGAAAEHPGRLSVGHEAGLAAAGCDDDLLVLAAEVQRMEAELEQCNALHAELADSQAEVRSGLDRDELPEVLLHAAACMAGIMCSAWAQQLAVMLVWSAQAMSTCCGCSVQP